MNGTTERIEFQEPIQMNQVLRKWASKETKNENALIQAQR